MWDNQINKREKKEYHYFVTFNELLNLGKKQWLCQKEKKRDDQKDESTNEIVPAHLNKSEFDQLVRPINLLEIQGTEKQVK